MLKEIMKYPNSISNTATSSLIFQYSVIYIILMILIEHHRIELYILSYMM